MNQQDLEQVVIALGARVGGLERFADETIKSLRLMNGMITVNGRATNALAFQLADDGQCLACGSAILIITAGNGARKSFNADKSEHDCEADKTPPPEARH